MRVFWPTYGIRSNRGLAVGWTLGEAVIVVAVVDTVDKNILKPIIGAPPLKVVAYVVPVAQDPSDSGTETNGKEKTAPAVPVAAITIWVDTRRPCAYSAEAETVLFRPPGDLERLTLGDGSAKSGIDAKKDDDLAPVIELLNRVAAEQGRLNPADAAKAKRKRYIGYARNAFTSYRMFGTFRTQSSLGKGMTPAGLIAPGVTYETKKRTLPTVRIGTAEIGGYSFGKDMVYDNPTPFMILHNAFTLYMFWSQLNMFTSVLLPYVKGLHSAVCKILEAVVAILSYNFTVVGYTLSLRRASVFLNQVAYRAERIVEMQVDLKGELEGKPLTNRFFTVRKAIGTDIAGGFVFSAILAAYPIPSLSASVLTEPIIDALNWLNEWPVGLKLNTPLSEYLSSVFSTALLAWRDNIAPVLVQAQIPVASLFLISSLFGLSFGFAVVADFIALLTLHLRLCYFVIAQVCSWQLSALQSLWALFRGKRWNVLRNRTDSHAYDVDTLFLGTLLFTLMTFLAPTALAYGVLFAIVNFVVVGVIRLLVLASGALDTLPMHDLESRVLKPARIPAGVVFDQLRTPQATIDDEKAQPPRFTLLLKGTPKSIVTIMVDWFHAAVRASNP